MRHLTFRERESISIGQTEDISEAEAESIKKFEGHLPDGFFGLGSSHAETASVLRGVPDSTADGRKYFQKSIMMTTVTKKLAVCW